MAIVSALGCGLITIALYLFIAAGFMDNGSMVALGGVGSLLLGIGVLYRISLIPLRYDQYGDRI